MKLVIIFVKLDLLTFVKFPNHFDKELPKRKVLMQGLSYAVIRSLSAMGLTDSNNKTN